MAITLKLKERDAIFTQISADFSLFGAEVKYHRDRLFEATLLPV